MRGRRGGVERKTHTQKKRQYSGLSKATRCTSHYHSVSFAAAAATTTTAAASAMNSVFVCRNLLKKKHAINMNNRNNNKGYIITLENESLKDKKKDMEGKKRVNFGGFTFLVLSRFLSICTVYSVGFCGKGGKKAKGSFFFRWASKKKKRSHLLNMKMKQDSEVNVRPSVRSASPRRR